MSDPLLFHEAIMVGKEAMPAPQRAGDDGATVSDLHEGFTKALQK